jgi:hypothetical protein
VKARPGSRLLPPPPPLRPVLSVRTETTTFFEISEGHVILAWASDIYILFANYKLIYPNSN